jgi:hypothetical protein
MTNAIGFGFDDRERYIFLALEDKFSSPTSPTQLLPIPMGTENSLFGRRGKIG